MADLRRLARDYLPVLALIALTLLVGGISPGFLKPANLLVVTADTMTLFLMASGATFVIMMGGIDLSIQAVASMASCIVAALLPEFGLLAVFIAILAGTLAGLGGGLVSTKLRIPSFIATLAVAGIVTTVAYVASGTHSVMIEEELSNRWLSWAVGDTLGVQNEIWVGILALVVLSVLLSRTPFGRFVRAIGSQERAVITSGIHVDRVKLQAFLISGTMAGLAGVVMGARLGSGSPTLANEFLLPAIACVIVGGTAITGGVGSIWKTFVGALIVAVVRIGMTFIGVSVLAQQIVFGVVLVAAVAATIDRSRLGIVK